MIMGKEILRSFIRQAVLTESSDDPFGRVLDRADEPSPIPQGAWVWFNQHGRYRAAEPVRIMRVTAQDVLIAWSENMYETWVSREELEHRMNPEIMDESDPRVQASLQPAPQPTVNQVYGGDPKKNPGGLGT